MKFRFYFIVFLLMLLAAMFGIGGFYTLEHKQWITSLLLFSICILIFLWIIHLFNKKINEIDKLLLSVIHKDFSLFPNRKIKHDVHDNAVRLYYHSKEENKQIDTFKILYENILDNLKIGVLILSSDNNSEWKVFYSNPEMINTLDVPKYKDWRFYKHKIPTFYRLIEEKIGVDSQDFMDISVSNSAKTSFSLRTSNLILPDRKFCIITLESVQSIIEKKEKLAWNNLMKVISHELLNTLTPIKSLIDNLEYISEQEKIEKEDQEEMKESLKIINSKSNQLLHFINNYRQVAELPIPQKSKVKIKSILENVLNLLQPEFDKKEILVQREIKDCEILADEKMVERVFINILTNAIFSFENQKDRVVTISSEIRHKRLIIHFTNNGCEINNKIKGKIFMPFFTTRNSGSGIGLTLAKSIMEAHNGYLTFHSDKEKTTFEVIFAV